MAGFESAAGKTPGIEMAGCDGSAATLANGMVSATVTERTGFAATTGKMPAVEMAGFGGSVAALASGLAAV